MSRQPSYLQIWVWGVLMLLGAGLLAAMFTEVRWS